MRTTVARLAAAALAIGGCTADPPQQDARNESTTAVQPTVAPTSAPPASPSTDPGTTVAPTTTVTSVAPAPTITVTTTTTTTTSVPVVGEPRVGAVEVARLERPVDLVVRPGDGRLYVVEQDGRIVRVDGDVVDVVADLRDLTDADGERGLLGLEFAPDGSSAYVNYTDRDGDTVVAEYPTSDDGVLDTSAPRIVLAVDQPFGNHNGGDLAVGPDGFLYIPLGDGGSGGDPRRHASDPTTLLGSLLRIDPRPSGDRPYGIPADNPFAAGPHEGRDGAPEVWAWGLRNPWKIDFDPVTGALWIADVGQNRVEEVDVVEPVGERTAGFAVDFGWSAFEGNDRFNTDVDGDGSTPPVFTYEHSRGCSISGGSPYRGTAIPELAPAYVYSDFCAGTVWAFDVASGRNLTLLEGFRSVTAVRTGPDGELYVLERTGGVHRLVPA